MRIKVLLSLFLFFIFALFSPSSISAQTVPTIGANLSGYVQPTGSDCDINIPSQYSTIQAGIDAANSGDTVCVAPGTYNENIMLQKSITLSGSGADSSIINGINNPQTIGVSEVAENNITIEGFKIIGTGTGFFQTTIDVGSNSSGLKILYNHIISGDNGMALRILGNRSDDLVQNNIIEGKNSQRSVVVIDGQSENQQVLNNTFTGTAVLAEEISDSGSVMGFGSRNGAVKYNAFDTQGPPEVILGVAYTPNDINYNNFNSPSQRKLGLSGGNETPLNAENNWYGTAEPTYGEYGINDINGAPIDYTPFAQSPFPEYPISGVIQLTSLSPAHVWVGLKNSDDNGLKFDLKVEAYKDNTLVSSGQLNSFAGGSSGFNNAHLATIPFNAFSPVEFPQGSALKLAVYVRNACTGSTHNSGTARLWYNDSQANGNFDATIGLNDTNYYLLNNFLLGTSTGSIKKTVDVAAGAKCSAFKPFGTWTITP